MLSCNGNAVIQTFYSDSQCATPTSSNTLYNLSPCSNGYSQVYCTNSELFYTDSRSYIPNSYCSDSNIFSQTVTPTYGCNPNISCAAQGASIYTQQCSQTPTLSPSLAQNGLITYSYSQPGCSNNTILGFTALKVGNCYQTNTQYTKITCSHRVATMSIYSDSLCEKIISEQAYILNQCNGLSKVVCFSLSNTISINISIIMLLISIFYI